MKSFRDLVFTAEPIGEGAFGKRYNLFVSDQGRRHLFGTLRRLGEMGWGLSSDDNRFRDFAHENIVMWCYARKNVVPTEDVLFVCRASYIMFYHREELNANKLLVDAAFLHGTRKDLEEALGFG